MGCLVHFARRVTAIELDVTYCTKLRARGFDVICRAVETVTPAEFAAAGGDVYFWWPMDASSQNEADESKLNLDKAPNFLRCVIVGAIRRQA